MKKNIKYLFIFIICFIAFNNLSSAIATILNLTGFKTSNFDYIDLAYYSTLMELINLFIVGLLYRKCLKKDLIIFKLNIKDFINKILHFFIIFIVVKFASSFATIFLDLLLGYDIIETTNQSAINLLFNSSPLVMSISCVILAPVVEECIFRLGLKKFIKNKYLFMIISGLTFGLLHVFPTELPYAVALTDSITYVTMGVCLAYIYDETNNIWVTIGIHMLNNLLGIISLLALL